MHQVLSEAAPNNLEYFYFAVKLCLGFQQFPQELAHELVEQLLFCDGMLDMQQHLDSVVIKQEPWDLCEEVSEVFEELQPFSLHLVLVGASQEQNNDVEDLVENWLVGCFEESHQVEVGQDVSALHLPISDGHPTFDMPEATPLIYVLRSSLQYQCLRVFQVLY